MLEQKVKIIPRAVLFGNPEKSDPKISPDGKLYRFYQNDFMIRFRGWFYDRF